jgi:plastocyanin
MPKIFVINKEQLKKFIALVLVLLLVGLYFSLENEEDPVPVVGSPGERVIHLVTGEYSAKTADGKEIEAYRWDPGTIFVEKGERVKLSIYGVNGASHPFIIEGMDVQGEVKKGEETIVTFTAQKEGTYRIICLTHPDIAHNGPMIGYIVVD